MRIRPLTGQVLIELLPPDDKTTGGLFLPDIAQDPQRGEKAKPIKGLVVEMGAWRTTRNGFGILPPFGIGAKVLCTPYSGQKVDHAINNQLFLVDSDNVLAVLSDG